MSPPGCRCAGQDFAVCAEREGSLLASFDADRGEGSGGGVARGHRMAVPAAGRCVCGGWPRGGGPPPGLPVVCRAAGVLVWLLAACPGGGPLPEDLRAQGAVRPVPGEPCAAARVRAGLAAG